MKASRYKSLPFFFFFIMFKQYRNEILSERRVHEGAVIGEEGRSSKKRIRKGTSGGKKDEGDSSLMKQHDLRYGMM